MTKNEFAEKVSASERRGSDRKKLIIDVRFSDGDATGIANTRDIGIGGLYMTTNARLEIGTPLSLSMTVNTREIMLSGVVVYTDPGHGVGIRFNNLSPADENLLMSELNSES